jgi:hypothetical protein
MTSNPVSRTSSRDLFPTDDPVDTAQLIGRDDDIDELVRNLHGGSHRRVLGPRRTGKTTICEAAVEKLTQLGFYSVAVDLFEYQSLDQLAEGIASQAIANRSAVRRILPAIRSVGRTALKGAALTMTTKLQMELGSDVELAFTPGFAKPDPLRHFAGAIDLMQKLATADDRHIILFIDEFQEIDDANRRFGNPDTLTKTLRARIQRSKRITCLFSGSREHLLQQLFSLKNRALYKFGGMQKLGTISPDEWRAGLTDLFMRDDCSITPEALALLVASGEGHPRSTMLIAQQTHLLAVTRGTFAIDAEMVLEGLSYAMQSDQATHEMEVKEIRGIGKHGLDVAQSIARGQQPYSGRVPSSAGRAISALEDADIITRAGERQWQIADPLFRRYLGDFARTSGAAHSSGSTGEG